MPNAYVYSRFSTPQQEQGNSLERQHELCQAMCKQKGWTIVETFDDKGKSAWKGDHLRSGKLGKFAVRVRNGEIEPGSILVVEQLDRLSRLEPRTTQRWMEDLCDLGLKIATVDGEKVYDADSLRGPEALMNVLTILIKAQVAHEHSQRKSVLNYDNWQRRFERAKAGEIISRRTPAWLSVSDEGKWVIDKLKKDTVNTIYRWSAEGQGNRMIAANLNEKKVHSFGGRGVKWTDKYVSILLHNPAVEGDYLPGASNGTNNGERYVGYFPRIVPPALVAQARAASESRKGTGGRYRRLSTNLFPQAIKCSHCGGPMALRPRQADRLSPTSILRKGLLQCRNANQKRGCDQRQMFAYQPFEDAALNEVLHLALDNRFFVKANETIGLVNEVAQLEKELADAKRDQASAINLAIKNPEVPAYQAEAQRLQRSFVTLNDALEDARKRLNVARGAVDAAEHQRRVFEVRDLLDVDDEETRIEARRKVAEAIKAMGVSVLCGARNGEREVTLNFGFAKALGKPVVTVTLDAHGKVLDRYNLVEATRMGVTSDWMNFGDSGGYGDLRVRQNLARMLGSGNSTNESREAAAMLVKRQKQS